MENNTLGHIALVAAMVAVVLSAGSLALAYDGGDSDDRTYLFRYCVGCGDADDAAVAQIQADITSIICNEFHSGFTLVKGCGATWIGGTDPVAVDANTLVYDVAFLGDSESVATEKAHGILDAMKNVPNTGGILMQKTSVKTELYIPGA